MEITTAILTLLFVMDPIGNVPVFMSVMRDIPKKRHLRIILREMLIALAVLIVFLFAGQLLLELLGLSQAAIQIAGAIVLFVIAINMLFPRPKSSGSDGLEGEPFIVPLAIPLVAGPSTMAVLMLMANTEPSRQLTWLLALVVAWSITCCILMSSSVLAKVLGKRGLIAAERLIGMLLIMLSVQMVLDGVTSVLL